MNYIIILLQCWLSVPGLAQGTLSTPAQKNALWEYRQAQAFRKTLKDILQCWPLNGAFEDVISTEMPVYQKTADGTLWSVVTMPQDRVELTGSQLLSEEDDISKAGVPFTAVLDPDPVTWLANNGFIPFIPYEGV